jgi:predicted AAA+ superfamily ATPase
LSSEDLINDFESLGLFFESLVVQNLRVYSDFLDSKVYFYKDSNNLEIDAIIEDRKGNFSAFEVKLGSEKGINDGIKNLRAFVNKLDPNKTKFLSSLNIIVASNYSYTTEDGINIIPLSHLFVE